MIIIALKAMASFNCEVDKRAYLIKKVTDYYLGNNQTLYYRPKILVTLTEDGFLEQTVENAITTAP
jgi:hypothetical protein